jgi:hypothetical protein
MHVFEPRGFRVTALPGKSLAFVAEFLCAADAPDFGHRIYYPLPYNHALLRESRLMYQAAFESARAYFYYSEFMARTEWVLSLQREIDCKKQQGAGI